MRNHSISNREAYQKIRPQNRRDRRSLLITLGYLLLAVVCVAGLFYLKQKSAEDRERNWISAVATIEDVRTHAAGQVNSQRGGAMFYDVQIFAKYSVDGTAQQQWITVQQQPKPLADAQLEAFRWKGKTCFVRWKQSDPEHVYAEVS
jgi:hypothetical protein